jgi:hypothetical protein
MEPNEIEILEARKNFKKSTIENVRNYLANGFVDMFEVYLQQMHTINRAIAMIPLQILNDVNPKDLFYEKFDDFCKDILKLYDEYIVTEVNFDRFHDQQQMPQEIYEHLAGGNYQCHIVEIGDHVAKITEEIIITPFFSTLGNRLVKIKVGEENYKRIEHLL